MSEPLAARPPHTHSIGATYLGLMLTRRAEAELAWRISGLVHDYLEDLSNHGDDQHLCAAAEGMLIRLDSMAARDVDLADAIVFRTLQTLERPEVIGS